MSNLLFCCSLPEHAIVTNGVPKQVLLRFYGEQSRDYDMSVQLAVFKLLSRRDLGPKLYGEFDGGRIEEYLPADSLTCDELVNKEISCIIAKKLAAVHSLEVPMSKEPIWILDRMHDWLEFIDKQPRSPYFCSETRQSTINCARKLLNIDLRREVKFVCEIIKKSNSPIVFSHNDLHQGNILLARACERRPLLEQRVILIDFEYGSYNYRAYDIANHFCEWCFEYDTPEYPHFELYEDRLPSKEMQEEFIRNYLEHRRLILKDGLAITAPTKDTLEKRQINGNAVHGQNHSIVEHSPHTDGAQFDDTEELCKIMDELKPFFMVSNLLWTLWCIRSAFCSELRFGFWEHSMARWKLYSKFKQDFLKEKKSAFNGFHGTPCMREKRSQ